MNKSIMLHDELEKYEFEGVYEESTHNAKN